MKNIIRRVTRFVSDDLESLRRSMYFLRETRILRRQSPNGESDRAYAVEARQYWLKYISISPDAHRFYASRNGIKDVRYVPPSIFYSVIEPTLNRLDFADAIDDKSYYPERLDGARQPEMIARGINGTICDLGFDHLSVEAARRLCCERDELVIKPSIGHMGGDRIRFFEPNRMSPEEFANLIAYYRGNFVIQAVLKQHPQMSSFNPSSVNTLRLMTLLSKGEATLLSAVLRVGSGGSRVDNHSSGGVFCGISAGGTTRRSAYDHRYRPVGPSAPGGRITNVEIPSFADAVQMVQQLHKRFGHFRTISWDVAIDSGSLPVLIELNLERQSLNLHQVANGPLFGDRSEAVLSEVFETANRKTVTVLVGLLERLR